MSGKHWMSRRQWTGLVGVLFGVAMAAGVMVSGSTPSSDGSGAADRYQRYWSVTSHQDHAVISALLMSYACLLLVAFTTGLSRLLRARDEGALPTVVAAAGATGAALFGAGGNLLNGVGAAASANNYTPDGNTALLLENVGYFTVAFGLMAIAMAVVLFSVANRRARVLPQWTIVLSVLLGLVGLGGVFTAWLGFIVLPVWSAVVGICLLALRDPQPATTT